MSELDSRITLVTEKCHGYVPDKPSLELHGFKYGDRVRVVEDDEEDAGLFGGDEGYVVVEGVGAAEYGNERVTLNVIVDGTDVPLEVAPDNLEAV